MDNVAEKIYDAYFYKMSKRYEQEQGENAKKIKVLRLKLKKAESKRVDASLTSREIKEQSVHDMILRFYTDTPHNLQIFT